MTAEPMGGLSVAALFQAHMQAEMEADLAGTMATMVDDRHLLNLASGPGGQGRDGVATFHATHLIGHLLPGVAPTGRRVEMALVVIVGVRDGLLDPSGLPIVNDTAARLLGYTGKG